MKVLCTYPGDMTVRLNDMRLNLQTMQEAVGGYIEYVSMGEAWKLIINEEGKVDGLDVNPIATALFQAVHGPTDVIVGPAIICGVNAVGANAAVPKHVLDVIRAAEITIVQDATT